MNKFVSIILFFSSPFLLAATDSKIAVGEMELEYCHIDGFRQEVLCGEYSVYEDRVSQQGRQIAIQFAVMPAVSIEQNPDPVVVFAGGPGQGARDMVGFVALALDEVNETRDIVLIDQRGMGASNPLVCIEDEDDSSLLLLSDAELVSVRRQVLQQCLLELEADVSKYTQDLANEDIHEILLALGYQQVNLWGGSWGTRSALLYASQFPQQVRTAILDGNAPLENKVPLYGNADAERALQILFQDCEYDIDCQNSFTMLEQDFNEVLDAFGEAGYQVTHNDATSGKPLTVNVTRAKFVNAIRSILYSPQISRLIPIIIAQAQERDFRALFAVLAAMQSDVTIADGAQLSVLCAEDFTRISNAEISRESNRGFVGDAFLDIFQSGCSVWPAAPLPEIYSQDLSSQVPTLILSGAIDPVTPERWGEAMAELMSNSVHLIAPNTGHNVSPFGCAPELMEQFVNEASVENIDGSCLDELIRPSFFLDLNGPTPAPATEIGTGVR